MLVIQAYDLGHNHSVYAQKKQQLQRALKLCPNHPDAHNNLAVVLENEQHYTQAIHHYQRTLQIDPDYYDAWIGIGEAYYKQSLVRSYFGLVKCHPRRIIHTRLFLHV
jgi:tetratricopeptide (TPR) repeat protein